MTGQEARRSTRRDVLPVNVCHTCCLSEFPRFPIRMQSTSNSCAALTSSSAGIPTRMSVSMSSGAIPCSCNATRALHKACSAALCCSYAGSAGRGSPRAAPGPAEASTARAIRRQRRGHTVSPGSPANQSRVTNAYPFRYHLNLSLSRICPTAPSCLASDRVNQKVNPLPGAL